MGYIDFKAGPTKEVEERHDVMQHPEYLLKKENIPEQPAPPLPGPEEMEGAVGGSELGPELDKLIQSGPYKSRVEELYEQAGSNAEYFKFAEGGEADLNPTMPTLEDDPAIVDDNSEPEGV